MNLDTAQLDRACGVLLATAAGDAPGAGYEFGPPLPADAPVTMTGGGHFRWAPGGWTDDTSMALAIAETAAAGADLRTVTAQDAVTARWAARAGGWVVEALQAAWCSIATTPVPGHEPGARLRLALENAVRGGRDADTVAAIAGGLLGAGHGASAVPASWRLVLHGWPGLVSSDLISLAAAIAETSR